MQLLVTGASGLVGAALSRALHDRGDTVIGVSRRPERRGRGMIRWIGWDDLPAAIEDVDAAVHLAGAGVVAKRWSAARKRTLRESRIDTAQQLVAAINGAANPPGVLVSASAVGYYGPRGDDELDEDSPAGSDFLATLCRDWEAAAAVADCRVVRARIGVVLSRQGGALPQMLLPFKLGLGGPIGRGRHWFSWVHIDDVVGALLHAVDDAGVRDAINVTAPAPLTNMDFSKALGRALHRPALVPVPPLLLELRFGEGAAILTAGQRVIPRRTVAAGYQFQYGQIDDALANLLA